eukprot:TRINITY_DN1031_c0_g1_i1.p1 TRINITY_DN1031_c0_g1~~TRINITY_DN1031_c0_g1_i1.p1  ORF type:complete len:201 (-),score=43.95 TRINITY_DN1031_c0_g1_i1:493-1095(-)
MDEVEELTDYDLLMQLQYNKNINDGREQERLAKLDMLLKKHYPNVAAQASTESMDHKGLFPKDNMVEMFLAHNRCRTAEAVFQPFALVGVPQMGIVDAMGLVLNNLRDYNHQLVSNVYTTGGNFSYRGVKQRIERDLKLMMPMGSSINVTVANDPVYDAWRGAALFSLQPSFSSLSISKAEYSEIGIENIMNTKKHFASN